MACESTAGLVGPDLSVNQEAFLVAELASYRDRWRATERVAEQRLLMLLGIVGSMLAATAALLALKDQVARDLDPMVGTGWLFVSIVSIGMMLRLGKARCAIVRSIVCATALRRTLANRCDLGSDPVVVAIREVDSMPPALFTLTSLPVAAAVLGAVSAACSTWFLRGAESATHPWIALVPGWTLFVLCVIHLFRSAARFERTLEAIQEQGT